MTRSRQSTATTNTNAKRKSYMGFTRAELPAPKKLPDQVDDLKVSPIKNPPRIASAQTRVEGFTRFER